jgi:outer membrane receptor protein involved in Fe transport
MRQAWSRFAGVLVLLLIGATALSAQTGKIAGIVTDQATGQPLEGAQIIIAGTGLQTLTGSSGRYFLINVPPGTYTLVARRIGYQTVESRNVLVLIDVTRELNFPLRPATTPEEIDAITVEVEIAPLVEAGVTGSSTNISAAEIAALPVTNIQGVLELQQGFLAVPQNTDIVSFTSTRRNTATPVRIRGGRGGETLTLIDNVPINNFVFGGPAFDITREAVQQIDFQRGGFEPQYGNALSGIINIATREGGTALAGSFSYQTSALGGALGNDYDDLLGFDQFEGYFSGPIPGTQNRLRFMAAGRTQNSADRVLEFDDDVFDQTGVNSPTNTPRSLDLFSGWRALGYDTERDIFGKLTFYFRPTMKLNVWATAYERERLPFDFDYVLTQFNALGVGETVNSLADTIAIGGTNVGTAGGILRFNDVAQGSVAVDRQMYTARWDHTLGRWAYQAQVSRFDQSRETCNFFSGVCLGPRFADINFNGRFVAPGITAGDMPGTDEFFGGEDLQTWMGRFDLQSQISDHHQIQTGLFYQTHDLEYREFRNQGVNDVLSVPQFYTAEPWDAAVYLQDRIEYDFLTIKLGARLDFGKAGGLFFVNPQDPTNSTTARQVCNGDEIATQQGVSDGTPFSFTDANNTTFNGFDACAQSRALLDSAALLAQGDDFTSSSSRTQFSPRIGVSFPLSETSQVFFNFGRYSQNPLYNNLFQNTNIGTQADEAGTVCSLDDPKRLKPGTTECAPNIFSDQYVVSFLGNPNLLIEKTTSYEVGYTAEFSRNFAVSVVLFNKDQFGLTGVREGGVDSTGTTIFDVGTTYGSATLNYQALLNQDFQTVRGFELQFRRRLSSYWGFNINYSFSQSTTNAAPPERAFQSNAEEGDPQSRDEIRSEIDQPHVLNGSLFFQTGDEPIVGGFWGEILRNFSTSVTLQARSGFPYTPTLSFNGFGDDQLEVNSGRGPGIFQVNLQLSKDFTLANVRYGAFARIVNLTDSQGCIQVFASTGTCNDGTIDQSRARQGNTVGENESSTFFDRPQFVQNRRSVNFGFRVSF